MKSKLHLAEVTRDDLAKIIHLEQKEENKKFIIPYTLDQHLQMMSNPDKMHFKILDQGNQFVGFVILAGLTNPHESIEFRRIVIEKKEKGFGRAGIELVIKHCFHDLKCHRLWLDVFEENARARHLYKSLGFVEEGTRRENFKTENGYRSQVFMSILENEVADKI